MERRSTTVTKSGALSGGAAYALSMALDLGLQLAIVPILTRTIPLNTFSIFVLLSVAAPFLVVVSNLGCCTSYFAKLPTLEDPLLRRRLGATLLWLRVVLGAGVALVTLASAPFLPSEYTWPVIWLAIAVWLGGIANSVGDVLRGDLRHKRVAAGLAVRSVVRMAASLWSVTHDGGVSGLVLAIAVGHLAAVVVSIGPTLDRLRARPSWADARYLIGFGAPAGGYFIVRSSSAIDRYIVGARDRLGAAGIFQLASMPTAGLDLLEAASIYVLDPYIYALKPGRRAQEMDFLFRAVSLAFLGAAIGMAALGPEFIAVLGPSEYAAAVPMVPWVLCAAAARSSARLIGTSSSLGGSTRLLGIFGAFDLIASFVLVWVVVPLWGPVGAVAARFVVAIALLPLGALLVRKGEIELPIVRVFAITVAACAASTLSVGGIGGASWPLPARVAWGLALVVGVAWSLGLAQRRAWTTALRMD